MSMSLLLLVIGLLLVSLLLAPRTRTVDGFFRGFSENGVPPSLWTLVLSQVTTWIFARSLMNAAILGYYYGIAGALAYAAYYLSFLTGGLIIDRIRFEHGHDSIQNFLRDQFGRLGTSTYNVVVAVRLLSEVFANLLVIGLLFGVTGSSAYTFGAIAVALSTLGYSMMGGLRASLRTDVFQTVALIAVLLLLLVQTVTGANFSFIAVLGSSPDAGGPGWILLLVALLQIWSYPMHDPVMMDRGFLADRATTRRSFLHASWIAIVGILIFGLLGMHAGLLKTEGEALVTTLTRLFGEPTMLLFNAALIISALSTLDSTFSSASKLIIVDMRLAAPNPANGRIAMALFLLGGLLFLFLGSKDLFAAVAVSGTASMFLAPVLFFNILGKRRVARAAYAVAFFCAMAAAAVYMLETGGYISLMEPLFNVSHKYAKLLVLCLIVLVVGCGAFALGTRTLPLKQGEEMA